jgi:anti-sigma regulatory factor (Ser/Thr protein kinase)
MDPQMSFEVRRSPEAAEEARDAVDTLEPLLTEAALDDVKLVVSELVSNSVRYGQGNTVRISLALDRDGALRGEVVDDGDGFVSPRSPPAYGAPDGLGLPIVDALVDDWGIETGSTHVWFEISGAAAGPATVTPRLPTRKEAGDFGHGAARTRKTRTERTHAEARGSVVAELIAVVITIWLDVLKPNRHAAEPNATKEVRPLARWRQDHRIAFWMLFFGSAVAVGILAGMLVVLLT